MNIPPATSVEVPFETAPSGAFDVAIDDADGYAADNVRYAINAMRTLPRVLIVSGAAGSGDGFYLSRALTAGGDEGPDMDVRTVQGSDFVGMSGAQLHDQTRRGPALNPRHRPPRS